MFGWEFPPAISGGLGVATLGLCKALAPMADVKMIIPKSVSEFSIPNITLIGLNSFTQKELDALFTGEQTYINEYFQAKTDWSFSPYEKIPEGEFIQSKFTDVFQESVQPFEIL